MNTEQLEIAPLVADIIAFDNEGRAVLLVEVKGRGEQQKEARSQLIYYLQAISQVIPFAMLATLETIHIYQWDATNLSEPIFSIKTATVLCHYDPEFGNKPVFRLYLTTLVEAWLRDLAYHWKSQTPPASEQLALAGLLQRLEGGTTKQEVVLNGDTLRRD